MCRGYKGSIPEQYSADLAQLVTALLAKDPVERPSVAVSLACCTKLRSALFGQH